MSEATPTIAVINSNEDTTEMLRAYLQSHGYTSVVLGHVPEIKRGEEDFIRFLELHDPRVFVWDVGLPYEENWRFLHLLMALEPMQGRRIVVTTTNKRALSAIAQTTKAASGAPIAMIQNHVQNRVMRRRQATERA